jgi:flagellin-specific chaperone FliS
MKNQEIINKRHRIQGGIMFIGGLDDTLDQEKEGGNGKTLTRRGYR